MAILCEISSLNNSYVISVRYQISLGNTESTDGNDFSAQEPQAGGLEVWGQTKVQEGCSHKTDSAPFSKELKRKKSEIARRILRNLLLYTVLEVCVSVGKSVAQSNLNKNLSWDFYCYWRNTDTKTKLRRKGFIWLMLLPCSPSLKEVGTGTQTQ